MNTQSSYGQYFAQNMDSNRLTNFLSRKEPRLDLILIFFRELDNKFRLTQKLTKVMACSNREEACLASEMEIRLYTRCLAWDLAGKDYGYRAVSIAHNQGFFNTSIVGCNNHSRAKKQAFWPLGFFSLDFIENVF